MKLNLAILKNPREQLPTVGRYVVIAVFVFLFLINAWFIYRNVFANTSTTDITGKQSGVNERLYVEVIENANDKQAVDTLSSEDISNIF